jgi:4-hydroxy-tetrahydrodipicolinate reductase
MGAIGRAVTRLIVNHRRGLEVVGVASLDADAVGRPVAEIAHAPVTGNQVVLPGAHDVLEARPDVVVLATGSFLVDVESQVMDCVAAGAHVVSPCEELAFPLREHTRLAGYRIHRAAQAQGVCVLGTGVNPGFIFDSLLAAATGVCWDVRAIQGRRVVDVAGFGESIHRRLGIGYTAEEFGAGHANGTIAGHVGFPESIGMVCERLGVALDAPVQEAFEPMVAETPAPTVYGDVPAGRTEGFLQTAVGRVGGEEWIRLELLLHLRPAVAGIVPSDTIRIDGEHPVNVEFRPGMDAIMATSAQLVNSIATVMTAPPGICTVTDLPDPAAWVGGDIRRVPGITGDRFDLGNGA